MVERGVGECGQRRIENERETGRGKIGTIEIMRKEGGREDKNRTNRGEVGLEGEGRRGEEGDEG